ncbi:lipopolysaccharide transport periplasmic protein LptA [Pseudomarimonas salicorniae]|uniref:Lipopolysaccharide transport periplasmic protein LptA n=1 Tax=Pseudomarimonas salicorniae TaxID=2933270 RepID=A0ABT0GFT6_9GAMM|nr:lipopolysaccharide transport periplasmic protein LptA [Lysobacter sp. CAU 1642]MCK7593404.1 lipopolysaccharide transport periplasmic protein LptA [Lysobacter sp. CAU 1642]
MNRFAASPIIALTLCAAALPALALESDRQQPIEFGAESLQGTVTANGTTRLSGGFWLDQGSLRIRGEQSTVYRENGAVVRVVLDGTPATVEQDLDSGGRMHAEALNIDYRIGSEQLELNRDVVIIQPEGELRGQRLRYDIGSGEVEGGGSGSGGVRMRIEPKPAAGES